MFVSLETVGAVRQSRHGLMHKVISMTWGKVGVTLKATLREGGVPCIIL